jgi:hypothetical protein
MSDKELHSAGTVSKILWHFTGGPTWNAKKKRQNKSPKPAENAYDNLISILNTRELRLGQYKEVLNIEVGTSWEYDHGSNRFVEKTTERKQLFSVPVCCLSDIPIAHLAYHADRYGRFAVGFHRESAMRSGFNPVFYTLESTKIVKAVYQSASQLETLTVTGISQATEDVKATLPEAVSVDTRLSLTLDYIDAEAIAATEFVTASRTTLDRLLAFTKTFSPSEFGTIYCEREWRSTETYSFTFDDVAMIVLPKKHRGVEYFSPFIDQQLDKLKLPRSIPVIPWEDLIEH